MDLQQVLALAYRYAGRRERSVHELRAHLEAKVEDRRLVEAAVEELTEIGMVDDARYARLFCEDKRNLEGWGSERIGRALRERGVDRSKIEAALDDVSSEDDRERALEILHRRFTCGPVDRRERERALGILLRKGYPQETALEVVARWSARGGFEV